MAGSVLFSSAQANLDLIRATAVLCVFFGHLYVRLTGIDSLAAWHFAQMGVLIFFVHTAYVLMWSLERSVRSVDGAALYADFYIRRLFRIYPLAILCVVLSWFGYSISTNAPFVARDFAANLTLTMNVARAKVMWPGLWTLPIEVQMYILLPVLFVWLRSRAVYAVVALWGLAVVAGLLQPTSRLDLMEYSPCFMAGVLAWHLARSHRPRFSGAWWPLAFVAAWTIWLIAPKDAREWYRWMFCLTLGGLIPWFQDLTWRPLTRTAAWIAKYSYGIYLSHSTVFVFALGFDAVYVRWPLLIFLAGAVPVLLYHVIEDPMIRVGRRLAERARTVAFTRLIPVPAASAEAAEKQEAAVSAP